MHSIHGLVENFVPYIIHNCFWTKQHSLNCIVGYETYWFVKNSSLWPRYWLELLQSFQDQLKDKTPHLLNLARKGFLILKLAIIISLSTKIYYQAWKDIVTYFKILIQSQGEYKSWWFTQWIELRIDVGIFTHQWYAGGFLFAKPLKGVSSQKQVK